MPYPNEHSARLKEPGLFDRPSFRRTAGGTIYGSKEVPENIGIIQGMLKGESALADEPQPQALRFSKDTWTTVAAKKWLADNSIKYILFEPAGEKIEHAAGPQTVTLKNIELVAAGRWKGHVYTPQDIAQMVANFKELKGKVNIKLDLGHDEEQRLIQEDGWPSVGIIQNLRPSADGTKGIGDISDVPIKVKELMDVNAYQEISPTIYHNWTDATTGKKYAKVFWAASLLGKDHKSMTTLDEYHKLYYSDIESLRAMPLYLPEDEQATDYGLPVKIRFAEPKVVDWDKQGKPNGHPDENPDENADGDQDPENEPQPDPERSENMDRIKELEQQLAEAKTAHKTEVAKFTDEQKAQAEKIEGLEKGINDAKTAAEKKAQAERGTHIQKFVEDGIKAAKILPKQKDDWRRLLDSTPEKVSYSQEVDGKVEEKNEASLDIAQRILDENPELVEFGESTEDKKGNGKREFTEDGKPVKDEELAKKADAYIEKHEGVTYREAIAAVEAGKE